MKVLVTGGSGYIGSHTIVELIGAGHAVVVIDNLSNSKRESLRRVEKITGKKVRFYKADLRDRVALSMVFEKEAIEAVLHLAGLKAVGESVAQAHRYYHNNIDTTLALIEVMEKFGVKKLVFSSSAAIYSGSAPQPVTEDSPRGASNPYGHTKLMIEQMLEDIVHTNQDWDITSLRYFNPIGAHESGLMGESPNGIPNNVLPLITQVAIGKLEKLYVFGSDYDTPDGSGLRDYIHIVDLVKAHLAALDHLSHPNVYKAYNIGSGKGVSTLELIAAFEKATGAKVTYEIADRRPGDIARCYADSSLALKELGWKAQHTIEEACASAWKWQTLNPVGY